MRERARSIDDKLKRSGDLLDAAEDLARELGGVRFVTMAEVTTRVGLHRTGVRRYYAGREELFLELAERGWSRWRDAVLLAVDGRTSLDPPDLAQVVAQTIASFPVFCDLLTHVTLSLEGEVDVERARRYKTNSFAMHDDIVAALARAGTMSERQVENLLAAAIILAAGLWQASHPTPALRRLYAEMPRWEHAALDFGPRLTLLLRATATGLAEMDAIPAPEASPVV